MATIEEKARFDTKLPKWQKEKFEKAASLEGYRSLTEFIVTTVNEKAEQIIEKHELVLATERDRQLFFEAIENPPLPNKALMEAAQRYKNYVTKK